MKLKTGLFLMSFLFLAVGCTFNPHNAEPNGPIRAKIPMIVDGVFKMQSLELDTITDFIHLKGLAAQFILSPTIKGGSLVGLDPKIHLVQNSAGEYLATDSFSLQLLTLYAHLEKLAYMDIDLGVADLVENWPRPRTVAVEVKILDAKAQLDKDNARYNGKFDAFLFVPYDRQDLPLSVNAGVIAHEHFHSLFHQLFTKAIIAKIPTIENSLSVHDRSAFVKDFLGEPRLEQVIEHVTTAKTLRNTDGRTVKSKEMLLEERNRFHGVYLRGLNEGLADVWGWIYSNEQDYIPKSLPQVLKSRALDSAVIDKISNDIIKTRIEIVSGWGDTEQISYQLGTSYARRIFLAVQKSSLNLSEEKKSQLKMSLGRAILKTMIRLSKEFIALGETDELKVQRPLQILQEELPEISIVID